MAEEKNALKDAKFNTGLYLKDFPAKVRILTRDPMVYTDNYGNTKYVFAVYNVTENKVQILDKGPGFPQRFQEIDNDPDFGGDIRKVDLKITTNGKDGSIEVRYTITPVGTPSELSKQAIKSIVDQGFDLAEKVQKNNPNAVRLSEINAGAEMPVASEAEAPQASPDVASQDVEIEDIGDEPIDINKIPF